MLDERLTDAATGVRTALSDLVPPPIEDVTASRRPSDQVAAGSRMGWRGPLVAAGTAVVILLIVAVSMLALRPGDGDVADIPIETTPTTPNLSTPTTLPPPSTIAQGAGRPVIEVTFNGATCSVTGGPTSVAAHARYQGGQAFVLTDDSGLGVQLQVANPRRGWTYEQLVAANRLFDSYSAFSILWVFNSQAHASFDPDSWPQVTLADNQTLRVWSLTTGENIIYVESSTSNRVWLCGPLEVTPIEF